MIMTVIADIIILLAVLISGIIVWELYDLTKIKAVLTLFFAIIYLGIVRLLLLFMPIPSTELVLPFWILFPVGMYQLHRIVYKFYKRPRPENKRELKRRWDD
jgi:hypothetical protein